MFIYIYVYVCMCVPPSFIVFTIFIIYHEFLRCFINSNFTVSSLSFAVNKIYPITNIVVSAQSESDSGGEGR